ncbi:hypothetical protein SKAU_G00049380 [Synaphobranchus kaupii]|uniref:Cystatin domain-containing protein n=1 Tax=Synaphobranchus kaupii TaxID=118154 RepID=A0A9Q1J999_SYNKA|nr:hypothetical protein SKAU_G00049380 [Synaphobranchus kaupii]
MIDQDDKSVLKTVEMSLEKYNRESRNANYFGLLNVTRASPQGGIADFTFAEFTIQETVCSNSTDVAEAAKCALMDCEFAQKTVKEPQGKVRYLPNLDRPVTLPSFPDQPELERPVVMPSFPDQPELERPVVMPSFPDQPELERPVVMPSFPDQPELERPVEKEPTILPFSSACSYET